MTWSRHDLPSIISIQHPVDYWRDRRSRHREPDTLVPPNPGRRASTGQTHGFLKTFLSPESRSRAFYFPRIPSKTSKVHGGIHSILDRSILASGDPVRYILPPPQTPIEFAVIIRILLISEERPMTLTKTHIVEELFFRADKGERRWRLYCGGKIC